jgi:hypothetical protein
MSGYFGLWVVSGQRGSGRFLRSGQVLAPLGAPNNGDHAVCCNKGLDIVLEVGSGFSKWVYERVRYRPSLIRTFR